MSTNITSNLPPSLITRDNPRATSLKQASSATLLSHDDACLPVVHTNHQLCIHDRMTALHEACKILHLGTIGSDAAATANECRHCT